MSEAERAAWAALEAGIVEDGITELEWMRSLVAKMIEYPLPHRCPNCEGVGQRPYPPPPNYAGTTAMFGLPQTCHSCQGKGVVWG